MSTLAQRAHRRYVGLPVKPEVARCPNVRLSGQLVSRTVGGRRMNYPNVRQGRGTRRSGDPHLGQRRSQAGRGVTGGCDATHEPTPRRALCLEHQRLGLCDGDFLSPTCKFDAGRALGGSRYGVRATLHPAVDTHRIASPWPVPLAALDASPCATQWITHSIGLPRATQQRIAVHDPAVDRRARRSSSGSLCAAQQSSGSLCTTQQQITVHGAAADRRARCSSSTWSKAWTRRIPSRVRYGVPGLT